MKTKEIFMRISIDLIPLSSPLILAVNLPSETQKELKGIRRAFTFAELAALFIVINKTAALIKTNELLPLVTEVGIYLVGKVAAGELARVARKSHR